MSYKPVVKKRRSDTPKAKNQQRCRRRTGLFKKAYEYGIECDADVCVVLRIRKNGQIFTFNSDSSGHWPPPQQELDLLYPKPVKKTVEDFSNEDFKKTPSISKNLKYGSRIED